MSAQLLAERVSEMIPQYEELFARRGDVTPTDPLEFHLYHLARYWNRLIGFCRQAPSQPAEFIDTDLGACVQVGSEFAHKLIGPDSPIYGRWQDYWAQTQPILHQRPVTMQAVEAASQAFEACVAGLRYDPWGLTSHSFQPTKSGGITSKLDLHDVAMTERDSIYVRILHEGLLRMRDCAALGHFQHCVVESEHLHNVPSLIGETNEQRHLYYFCQERVHYLEHLDRSLPGVDFTLRRYVELWTRLSKLNEASIA